MWASYKPMNATHIYATNASIRHFVLHAANLTAAGSGVDGTWEDAGDALTASGDVGAFDADAVFTPNAAVECDTIYILAHEMHLVAVARRRHRQRSCEDQRGEDRLGHSLLALWPVRTPRARASVLG